MNDASSIHRRLCLLQIVSECQKVLALQAKVDSRIDSGIDFVLELIPELIPEMVLELMYPRCLLILVRVV